MAKTKDGFYKDYGILSDNYILLAAGGHKKYGNETDDIPVSNGTMNVDLFAEYAQKVKPLYEQTYIHTCTSNDDANGYIFFGNVKPTSGYWQEPWEIYYTLVVNTPNANCQGVYDVIMSAAGSTLIYHIYNRFYSGSYRPIYHHVLLWHDSQTRYNNRATYPAKIGVRVRDAYNVTSLQRTYNIKVWKLTNCEFEFPSNVELRGSVYNTTNYALTQLNGTDLGLQETGDTYDTTTMQLAYSRLQAGANGIKQYSLIMQDGTGKWQSFTSGSGTGTSKAKNTNGFRLGSRIYYVNRGSDLAANGYLDNSSVRTYQALIDFRYILNITANSLGNGLTYNKPIFIVGKINETDGLFYLNDTWWTQDEPTSEDGNIYIRVAEAVYPDYNISSMPTGNYRADFLSDGYAFYYTEGKIKKYGSGDSNYRLYIGVGNAASSALVTNPYIKLFCSTKLKDQYQIIGSGATSVQSNNGNITISSTDNKVTQTLIDSSNTNSRPLIIGYSSSNANPRSFASTTNTVYATYNMYVDPADGRLTLYALNNLFVGTGTIATTSGSNYIPAKWTFNKGIIPKDGDIFTIKIPVDGHDYGVFISLNNGTNYYPVVLNGTGRLTSHYPAGTYLLVTFEGGGQANSVFPVAGGTSRTNVSGGVFRVLNYYNDNDTTNMYLPYSQLKAGTSGIKENSLVMQAGDGTWQSFTTNNGVGTSKSKNTTGFRLGSRIYYTSNGNIAANSNMGTWVLRAYVANIDFRYSTNCGTTLTAKKPLYIVGTINTSNGLFYLDDTWWTQNEPTSANGKIYIRVCEATYNTYQGDLVSDGYAFWFKNGKFQRYGLGTAEDIPKALISKGTTATITAGEVYGIAGNATSGSRIPTRWFVNLDNGDKTLKDGMIISFRLPTTGLDTVGECITIDGNQQNFHQVVYNTNSKLTTHFEINSVITLQYDATISCDMYGKFDSSTSTYVQNGNTTTSVTGVWRLLTLYNGSNDDTKVTQTATTTDANYEILFSATADNTTRTETARKTSTLLYNPYTKTLSTTLFHSNASATSHDYTHIPTSNEIALETGNGNGGISAWIWREMYSSSNWGIFHNNSTDYLHIVGNSTSRISVNLGGGNVGIGTDSPSYKLEVNGTFKTNSTVVFTGLDSGSSNVTDGTEILTSYASNNGFADTNGTGIVYRRQAIKLYNYIKGKLDSVYQAIGSIGLYVGGSGDLTANSAQTTNGNVYLTLKAGSTYFKHNIAGGTGISVTSDANGKITITNTAPDVDEKVKQSETTTSNWRGIVLGYNDNASANTGITGAITNVVYTSNKLTFQPSTGAVSSLGRGTFAGLTVSSGDLIFNNTSHILWNSGSWYQRIYVTDDSTNNTAVFNFQQSSNSGSSWSDLFTIRDNGHVYSNGFHHNDHNNDNAVLLAGGGWKAISDFSMAHSHPYLPLAGGTMTLGEGLRFEADDNYFGTNLDARIITLLDTNSSNSTVDGGLIFRAQGYNNGTLSGTQELLRIRNLNGSSIGTGEFQWKGYEILHGGNISPSIGINGNTIRITVGGINSSYITVPYATNSGYASSAGYALYLKGPDNRSTNNAPSWYMTNRGSASLYGEFCQTGGAVSGTYEYRMTMTPWGDNSGQRPVQMAFNNSGAFIRTSSSDSAWNSWNTLLDSSNYTSYLGYIATTPVKASSTPAQNITGTGNITPNSANNYSLGASNNGFGNVYASIYNIMHSNNGTEIRGTISYVDSLIGGWGIKLVTNSNGPNFQVDATNVYMNVSASTGLYVYGGSYYSQIRPESSTWASFYTNSSQYYFSKSIYVNGAIWRYSTNYGIADDGQFYAKAVYANRDGSSTYGGVSLYSNDANTYAVMFRGTGNRGKWGDVQSDWATYFTMSNTLQRGWVWQSGTAEANMSAALSVRGVFATRAVGNNAGYLAFPQNNSYYTSTATVTGALKVVLPRYQTNTMIMFDVNIFTYNEKTSNLVTYRIGGYEYGSTGWYAPVSKVFSWGRGDKVNLDIRFGYDGSNTCITIGETNTTWSYPQVSISNITYGYSDVAISSWGYGWDISFVTSLPSSVSTSFTDPYFNGMYWANQRVRPTSSITTTPQFGKVMINTTSTTYQLNISGDSYTTGWSRAGTSSNGAGFYCEGTGVHFTHQGSIGEIDMTSNNEFLWGSSGSTLYFNYRGVSRGTTVTNYIWNAGSSTTWASHNMGTLTIRGQIISYPNANTASSTSWTYPGGGYYATANPNIRLIGDNDHGISTIEFVSQKGDTSINKPSDCAFIQFNPYGISALSAIASQPTLATSGEINRLIIGVNNDSNDQLWLQTPGVDGLRHIVGTNNYRILTSQNTYVSNGKGYINDTEITTINHSSTVTVNNSDANSTYRMVWHSGNTLYSTNNIYCNPSSDTIYNNGTFANIGNSNSSGGLSLYGTDYTYGVVFRGTGTGSNWGTHGGVTSDWATYFTMNDNTARGWIFRRGSTNVASIDGNGRIYVGAVTSSANPGLYWNPYVESSSDGSDAAGIWQIKSGVAGGSELRISQQNDSTDVINICAPYYIYFNSKRAFTINDSWLRINENLGFSSGIYTGSSLVRSDNQLQVGSSGSAFYANSSGNGYFSNTLGIAGTNTGYKLYVNGSGYFTGHVNSYGFHHLSHNNNDAVLLAGGGWSYINSLLPTSIDNWQSRVGNTITITVTGDSNKYYPVKIAATRSKTSKNYVSIWKDLGSQTASYSGNHSNGTSSCWYIFEGRYNGWDGNGGYWLTYKAWYGYARLLVHAEAPGNAMGDLIVWLRGGGTLYYISTTYPSSASIYYSTTNATGSSQYTYNVSPRTESTSGNNWGILRYTYIANIDGTATYSTYANNVYVTQNISSNADYPLIWTNQNNTKSAWGQQLHKSYDYLLYNPSTKVLRNDGPLWLRPDRDATIKIYSGKITDGYSDGFICMQTSIDGTDGQSHSHPTNYGARCVIALQPRGGEVYVGKTITAASTSADTTYKLNVGGNVNADGNLWVRGSGVYLRIGPQNGTYAHYETNASTSHWFNKRIDVDGDIRLYNGTAWIQSSNGHMYSNGFHHRSINSDNYVLLAGGSYKEWSTSSKANTIVARDANQYIYATYYNSNISDENSITIGSVYVRNNSDNWIRRMSFTNFINRIRESEIYTVTKSLKVGKAWINTGIDGTNTNLTTGVYVVCIWNVNNHNQGVYNYSEYYAGIMSWFNGTTNSTDSEEILLHNAGHASNEHHLYLRTLRRSGTVTGGLLLQIACDVDSSAATDYVFKFRRLI